MNAANSRVTEAGRRLTRFTGDYTWLAERVGEDGSVGVGPVGPADQRYGAFARHYASGQVARVRLDPEFLRSLRSEVLVRVIALGEGVAEVRDGGTAVALRPRPDRWSVLEFRTDASALLREAGAAQIEVRALERDLLLHLIEVCRVSPASKQHL